MDEALKIDNHPSIKVIIKYQGKTGRLNLSSLYGSYNIKLELDVPKGEFVRFFCPYCKLELKSTRICEICKAPMVAFETAQGCKLQICARYGCKKHLIEFEDLESEIREFYDRYSTFFKGD
jgi:hypothetical protein